MNDCHAFSFQGHALCADPTGALVWAAQGVLVVSDLHLGKSDRIARRSGRMLPPYETRATLDKLATCIDRYAPSRVICLGDSFDDLDAADSLDDSDLLTLLRLQAGRDWIWIEGNHDAGPVRLGGRHLAAWTAGGLTFRHIAQAAATGEISGHYHPKCGLPRGGTRPAFLIDAQRIILPAFGVYTGGLRGTHPALRALMAPDATAVLTGARALPVPFAVTC